MIIKAIETRNHGQQLNEDQKYDDDDDDNTDERPIAARWRVHPFTQPTYSE